MGCRCLSAYWTTLQIEHAKVFCPGTSVVSYGSYRINKSCGGHWPQHESRRAGKCVRDLRRAAGWVMANESLHIKCSQPRMLQNHKDIHLFDGCAWRQLILFRIPILRTSLFRTMIWWRFRPPITRGEWGDIGCWWCFSLALPCWDDIELHKLRIQPWHAIACFAWRTLMNWKQLGFNEHLQPLRCPKNYVCIWLTLPVLHILKILQYILQADEVYDTFCTHAWFVYVQRQRLSAVVVSMIWI